MKRRHFLRAAAGVAALRPDSLGRAKAASGGAGVRSADEVARDESYWREIQEAFTIDRNLINLNNGGVCPSPRVVQDAMRRYLRHQRERREDANLDCSHGLRAGGHRPQAFGTGGEPLPLEFSNMAPTHNMWRILEPEIESHRRAASAAVQTALLPSPPRSKRNSLAELQDSQNP